MMTFRQLEDQINTWLSETEILEADFQKQAQAINSWDSILVNNAVKIVNINKNVEELRIENNKLDRQLDFIVEQQREIEKAVEPLMNKPASNDDRGKSYHLLETVQNELNSLSEDLTSFIEKLNATHSDETNSNPIEQIEQVLNNQIDALQWVEREIRQLQTKFEASNQTLTN